MKPDLFPGRSYFKSSGRVDWLSFLRWVIIPFGLAAILAWILFGLFRLGHYYIGIVPAVAALAVAGCLKLAVNKGQCRSRLVAGATGICAGAILYLGYYYFGMVHHLGQGTGGRLDLLPSYIRIRMHVDVVRDTHESRRDATPRRGNVYVNYGVFGFEALLVLGITTAGALTRARRPYCEACGKWMKREVTHFEPASTSALLEAIRGRSATSLAALASQPVFATVPSIMLALDFCPSLAEGIARDCGVYASLKQVTRAGSGGPVLDPFDSAQGKVLVRSLALNPDEVAALGIRFPSLGGGTAASRQTPGEGTRLGVLSESGNEPIADIRPVPSDSAGKVLTRRNALIGNAWTVAALVLLFAGLGLAALGGLKAFPDDKTVPVSTETKALGIAGLIAGCGLFFGSAIFFLINPNYLGNRFLLKVVKREFSRRTGCVVEPNDREAVFVEIVPKLNWGRIALESASDVGFLRLDKGRRELLFEGDKERWRIPAAAITSCNVEFFVQGQGTHAATKIFFVVLRARRPGEFWEAPIRERSGTGIFYSGRRKRAAERLCAEIREMGGAVSNYRGATA